MATRLSRWSLVALGGSALIAGLLIPSSGAPIFVGYGPNYWPDAALQVDPVAARKALVERAIDATRHDISVARGDGYLEPFRAARNDPRVFTHDGKTLRVDLSASAVADSIWQTLPERDPQVRTVMLYGGDTFGRRGPAIAKLRGEGICLVTIPAYRRIDPATSWIGWGAGECAYSEWFGWPGQGVRGWLDSLPRSDIQWSTRGRPLRWYEVRDQLERTPPAWFTRADWRDYYATGDWYWSSTARSYMACVNGRQDECVTAFGVNGTWPAPQQRFRGYGYSYGGDPRPTTAFPAALFQELGADRFRKVWRADQPIAVSYREVTGRPIDEWLTRWAQSEWGIVTQDIGLSLSGWVGLLVWVALLGGWGAMRFRERVIG